MNHLENLNLKELSIEEQVNIDGGWRRALYKIALGIGEAIASDSEVFGTSVLHTDITAEQDHN